MTAGAHGLGSAPAFSTEPGGVGGIEVRAHPKLGVVLRSELHGFADLAHYGITVQSSVGLRYRPRGGVIGAHVGFGAPLAWGPRAGWVTADLEAGHAFDRGAVLAGPHLQVTGSFPLFPTQMFGYTAWIYTRPGVVVVVPEEAPGGGTVALTVLATADAGLGIPHPDARLGGPTRDEARPAPGPADGGWYLGARVAIGFVWRPPGTVP